MKLRGRYRLLLTGDTYKAGTYGGRAIAYLFERLLTGAHAEMGNLRNVGIEVRPLDERDEIITLSEPDER